MQSGCVDLRPAADPRGRHSACLPRLHAFRSMNPPDDRGGGRAVAGGAIVDQKRQQSSSVGFVQISQFDRSFERTTSDALNDASTEADGDRDGAMGTVVEHPQFGNAATVIASRTDRSIGVARQHGGRGRSFLRNGAGRRRSPTRLARHRVASAADSDSVRVAARRRPMNTTRRPMPPADEP